MCRGLNNHQRYECTESLLSIKEWPFKKDNDLGMFNCSSVHPTKWIANRREHHGKLYRCSVGWLSTSDWGELIYWFRWWTTQYHLTSLIVAEYVIDVFTEKATIMPDSLLQTEFHVCLQTTNAIRPKNPLNMQVYWEKWWQSGHSTDFSEKAMPAVSSTCRHLHFLLPRPSLLVLKRPRMVGKLTHSELLGSI